jgi:hypothetical protein
MFENLPALTLARIQFAFTISFHIIFPAFTIGLASWLAVLEWRFSKTGNPVYSEEGGDHGTFCNHLDDRICYARRQTVYPQPAAEVRL